ncbi:MAG TPA: hypothetical protein VNO30_01620 [Kofleriaceae bacterium]|nr:hypothetical protein [Kofleriaceae bacterium]
MKRSVLVLGFLAWLGSTDAHATPDLLSFTGQLSTASGPVDGPVTITFTVFDAPVGGAAVWADTVSITADLGRVAATLGRSSNPIGEAVFTGADRFLEIKVQDETLSPRLTITAVPYAIRSATAAATTDPNVQRRTPQNMSCPPGQFMRRITPAGDAECLPALQCARFRADAGSRQEVTAFCPAGSFVTGGGCGANGPIPIQESYAKTSSSWYCQFSQAGTIFAFAVCCSTP